MRAIGKSMLNFDSLFIGSESRPHYAHCQIILFVQYFQENTIFVQIQLVHIQI